MISLTTASLSVALSFTFYIYFSYKKLYKKLSLTQSSTHLRNAIECQTPIHIPLQHGSVPSWLNGIMYRIGPGTFNIQQKDGAEFVFKHAFDGLPFVHRFEINGQTQTLKYNSRMTAKGLETKITNKDYQGIIFFAHLQTFSFFEWSFQVYSRITQMILKFNKRSDSADSQSVGVTTTPNFPLPQHFDASDNVLVSKTDANILQKLHADTLEPEELFTYTAFDERLEGQFSASHHQWDPETNETFNFTLTMAPVPRIIVFSTSKIGKVNILADITHRFDNSPIEAPYIHSFWLTKNYVIIPEAPFTYKDKGINLMLTGTVVSSMYWDDKKPFYFHVIDRHQKKGLIASIPINPSFATFHTSNAFEKDGMLYLDCSSFPNCDSMYQVQSFGQVGISEKVIPQYKKTNVNGTMLPQKPIDEFGDLTRYQLDLKNHTVQSTLLARNIDFLRFNHAKTMKEYQYVYGCQYNKASDKQDDTIGLIKVNLESKQQQTFTLDNHICSEPIFVPNPESRSEDDGVLLSLANSKEICHILIIDALKMKEVARFKIGQFTPVTFHGSYVDHEFKSVSPN